MNWHSYFFEIINIIAKKSKDPSTKVGCVIVSDINEIVSSGFNGFPRGVNDKLKNRYERETKLLLTEHAERNAIYAAARRGIPLQNCRMYIDWYPCADCMRGIIQSGINNIYINGDSQSYQDTELLRRWKKHITASLLMAEEANINIYIIKNGSVTKEVIT